MKKLIVLLLLIQTSVFATTVRFQTTLGDVDILMYENDAPGHVANFLKYVNDGDYDDSIFHRAVPGFVLQGGGFYFNDNTGNLVNVPTDPAIVNEPGVSNTRATISMAKLANQPNSATSQFFFNLADNGPNLDVQNGGFTVFGEVVSGMEVVDLISSLHLWNNSYPVLNYAPGDQLGGQNLIHVEKAFVLSEALSINSALSGGWFNPQTAGQGIYLEVLPNSEQIVMAWFAYDTFMPDDQVQAVLGDTGHRWFTSQGGYSAGVYSGEVYLTKGGLFDDATRPNSTAVGTITVEFTDCMNAIASYEFTDAGISGSFPLTRLSGENVALCETLSSASDPGVVTQ